MGLILDILLERSRQRQNTLEWMQRKHPRRGRQEGLAQFEWRSQEPYDFSQRSGYAKRYEAAKKSSNVSLPPPNEPALGLDWAASQSGVYNPPPTGPREGVSKPVVNRGGSTINLTPAKLRGKSEIQETLRGSLSQGTDQKPIIGRRSSGASWDGVVRNTTRPSYLTTPRKAGKQKPELSIKNDPYSFY